MANIQERILLPESMSEITLANFQRFQQRAEGQSDARVMQLAVQYFCHVEARLVYMMDINEVMDINAHIADVMQQKLPVLKGDEQIKIGDKTYQFNGDRKWSFGEFIELSESMKGQDDLPFSKIARIVWREVVDGKVLPFTAQEEDIVDFPLDWGLATTTFFSNAFTSIKEEFPELFDAEGGKGSTMDFSMERGFSDKWGWIGKIDTLANGDVLKWDAVENTYFRTCLIKMIFDNEKQELINRKIKQQSDLNHG